MLNPPIFSSSKPDRISNKSLIEISDLSLGQSRLKHTTSSQSQSLKYKQALSSTELIRPCSITMPIRALVKLFAVDQLVARLNLFLSSEYFSATITPCLITTTAWVFLFSTKA